MFNRLTHVARLIFAPLGFYCEGGRHWYLFRKPVANKRGNPSILGPLTTYYCRACWVAKKLMGDTITW